MAKEKWNALKTHCLRSEDLRVDPGKLLYSLKAFAHGEHLSLSSFKAIGTLSDVELGWFDWETRKYQAAVNFKEHIEFLSLIGDIALKDDEPQVQAHLVVGRKDGTAHGGIC
jgi:predicted DNA-binding protein with PD1-like motif